MQQRAIVVLAVVLSGCWSSHGVPPDAGDTPAPRDAGQDAAAPTDAGPEPLETLAAHELEGDWWIADAVATVDGEVCVSGKSKTSEESSLLPDVARNDAFVACFDPTGTTRARTWPCAGDSFGAGELASNAAGDLFVELPVRCEGRDRGYSTSVMRLDRGLEVRSVVTITAESSPVPFVNALGATSEHVVVAGASRGPARVGEHAVHGPFVAVLRADDLAVVRVVDSPPTEEPSVDLSVRFLEVREDGVALLFGRDYDGGAFRSSGGPFVRTMALPDGPLVEPPEEAFWHHQYEVAWHPDGRPTAIGTAGRRILQIQVGGELHSVSTGYANRPHAAYRGDELLIARPFFGSEYEIAGRMIDADRWGGFLVGVDARTFEARWARGLAIGYQEYRVVVMSDETIAIVASRAYDGMPGMHLAFYR